MSDVVEGRNAPPAEGDDPDDDGPEETAVLGGGCFWCLEPVFDELRGVRGVEPGYAGGHHPAPTYREVCRGTTGHAEVVRIRFDPRVIAYRELLRVFFAVHDPTTPDRQGADVGPQYRSVILVASPEQEEAAREAVAEEEASGRWGAPVVTEVAPLERFHPAEPEHRDFFRRNPGAAYCQVVIAPKVGKVREAFGHLRRE